MWYSATHAASIDIADATCAVCAVTTGGAVTVSTRHAIDGTLAEITVALAARG
jgi:hypothetical protein